MSRVNTNGVPGLNRAAKARPAVRFGAYQKLAMSVGGVACFLLVLSVWDCTLALNRLTGMPVILATLMAVGIDFGMVVCEMAAVVSGRGTRGRYWSEWYVHLAVALSVCLNATAAASHASGWFIAAAVPVGGVIPIFIYIAGRTAGSLWTRKSAPSPGPGPHPRPSCRRVSMILVESDLRAAYAGVAYWRTKLREALRRRHQPGVMGKVWRRWARRCVKQLRQWRDSEGV
jgi:hypothetical protein